MREEPTGAVVRRPGVAFAVFAALVVASAFAYVAWRASGPRDQPGATAPPAASTASLDVLRQAPHVYYRSTRTSEFGRLVVGALDAPNDARVVADVACERLTAGHEHGVCLVDNRVNLQPPALARLLDRGLAPVHTLALPGYPSRTRLSRDERYAATTVFVSGERYVGSFATRTHVIDLAARTIVAELEQFSTRRAGQPFSAVDFNFWGVTFTDDSNRFYATLATGGTTYLVAGDLARRQLEVLRENVECPSLSPDGRRLAFKKRLPDGAGWRLHVLDFASMTEWPIAGETRSVDDQAEWLDDAHVLYHVRDDIGSPETAVNVWVTAIAPDATAPARIFIKSAMSPAVVRPRPLQASRR